MLVYAHRVAFRHHKAALRALRDLATGDRLWAIPVFVLGEFLRVVTHPYILNPPTAAGRAVTELERLLESPSARIISPGERYWQILRDTVAAARVRGEVIFDAQIFAVCREHGVDEILTEDRDFEQFKGIKVRTLGPG